MKKHFLELFKYDHWANLRILGLIEDKDIKDGHIIKLFSHLLSAKIIWHHRIKDLPTSPFPLWEIYKIREIKSMIEDSNTIWKTYLEKEHPSGIYEEMIFYKNMKGDKCESVVRQILAHVVNHGTYHRAQIASRMRDLGIDPPNTDFITFSREPQV